MAIITGTTGDDVLEGGASADEIYGLGGNDVIEGAEGDDMLDGGDGDDLIYNGAGDDQIFGGAGIDSVALGGWPIEFSVRRGPGGSFTISHRNGFWGTDVLNGVERLVFGDYVVNLADLVPEGTAGNDLVEGTAGFDWLFGHAGDDTLRGGAGTNVIDGGEGDDTAVYSGSSSDYRIYHSPDGLQVERMAGDGEDSMLLGYDLLIGVERIRFEGDLVTVEAGDVPALGTAAADILTGTARNDLLMGEEGNDELRGLGGDDLLTGGLGDDLLVGGAGTDTLIGGDGADLFVFLASDSGTGAAADRIADFTAGLDVIDLSALDADGSTPGDQAFTFIGGNAFSGTAGELRFAFDGSVTRVQGDMDGDSAADFEILLSGEPALLATDFLL